MFFHFFQRDKGRRLSCDFLFAYLDFEGLPKEAYRKETEVKMANFFASPESLLIYLLTFSYQLWIHQRIV